MISVIIATYGGPEWEELALTRALPSVREQAEDIIVGHDPDATIAAVRNELATKARGDWLCFLDADDELDPGYIRAMERVLEDGGLHTPIVQQVIRGRPKQPRFYPEVDLTKGNWLVVGTVLQRSLFMEVRGFEDYPHGFEDWSLWHKCVRLGAHVVRVRRAIYRQHVNPNSKHRLAWKDRRWQVDTHQRVARELEAWTP